jgi:hypothetical protein
MRIAAGETLEQIGIRQKDLYVRGFATRSPTVSTRNSTVPALR